MGAKGTHSLDSARPASVERSGWLLRRRCIGDGHAQRWKSTCLPFIRCALIGFTTSACTSNSRCGFPAPKYNHLTARASRASRRDRSALPVAVAAAGSCKAAATLFV